MRELQILKSTQLEPLVTLAWWLFELSNLEDWNPLNTFSELFLTFTINNQFNNNMFGLSKCFVGVGQKIEEP